MSELEPQKCVPLGVEVMAPNDMLWTYHSCLRATDGLRRGSSRAGDRSTAPHRGHGRSNFYVEAENTPVLGHNSGCGITVLAIGDDPLLAKAAERAGKNQMFSERWTICSPNCPMET